MTIQRTPAGAGLMAILLFLAFAPRPAAGALPAPAPAADILAPMVSVPDVATLPQGQFYVMLLRWSRNAVLGPVTVRVTYLDPGVALAWLRQANPNTSQQDLRTALSGFPATVRFRVAYQAAERSDIRARDWILTLRGPDSRPIPASDGHRSMPVDLKTAASGDYWEDDWDYQVQVPATFLARAHAGIEVALSGPRGATTLRWNFGRMTASSTRPDAFVPYFGGILITVCLLIGAALLVTRPPRKLLR